MVDCCEHKRSLEEELAHQKAQRSLTSRQVIDSTSQKKVIVSGPGTGKTYVFTEMVKQLQGDSLAITFINNLVEKLKRELPGRVKCCTFHSCCRQLLHKIPRDGIDNRFNYFPIKLDKLIYADSIICGHSYNFDHCFKQLEHSNPALQFFIVQGNYYNAVSFDDSVYRALGYFQINPDAVPVYDQIVVDEYQDFNPLEVAFIDVLSAKNKILIVGDDDQALYSGKDASSRFIRNRFAGGDYEPFQLPYCTRCTQVVVDAVADIVSAARRIGRLDGRIDKEYKCYLPAKLEDSKKYPRIIYAACSVQSKKSSYAGRFIEQQISALTPDEIKAANEKGDYTILVAGPSHYLKQIYPILKSHQDWQVHYSGVDDNKPQTHLSLLDGYKILLERDIHSNLGWRILLEVDPVDGKNTILKTAFTKGELLFNCLPKKYIKQHEDVLDLLREVCEGHQLPDHGEATIKSMFKMNPPDLQKLLSEDPCKLEETTDPTEMNPEQLSIILTSYVGCKGLSAGYVFITGLNEGCLPRNNRAPTDFEICEMIVALTRTIKRCYLLSVSNFSGKFTGAVSQFIGWINHSRLTTVKVDKSYWRTP